MKRTCLRERRGISSLAAIETGQNPRYNHNRVIIAKNRAYDDIIGKPVRRTIVRGARVPALRWAAGAAGAATSI